MKKTICALLILGTVAFLAPTLMSAPLLDLPEKEFDFGYAPQNSKISHVFWLHNRGDDVLLIKKVVPG